MRCVLCIVHHCLSGEEKICQPWIAAVWCKPSTSGVQFEAKKVTRIRFVAIFLLHLLQQAHYPAAGQTKKLWKRRGWESTTQEVLRLWKILFLQFQTDRKGVFSDDHSRQHWNPSHWGFGRGDNDLYWRKLEDLTIPSFAGFFLSGRPRCGICCFCLSPVGGSVVCICWNSSSFLRWQIAQQDIYVVWVNSKLSWRRT